MWEKKVLTYCTVGYGSYQTFEEAQEAGVKDSNCAAIYDGSCDNDGFYLCRVGYTEKVAGSSCLYIKPVGTVNI